AWVTKAGGGKTVLARGPKRATRAEAEEAFRRHLAGLKATHRVAAPSIRVDVLVELFLGYCHAHRKPLTAETHHRRLRAFGEEFGARRRPRSARTRSRPGSSPTARCGSPRAAARPPRRGARRLATARSRASRRPSPGGPSRGTSSPTP